MTICLLSWDLWRHEGLESVTEWIFTVSRGSIRRRRIRLPLLMNSSRLVSTPLPWYRTAAVTCKISIICKRANGGLEMGNEIGRNTKESNKWGEVKNYFG